MGERRSLIGWLAAVALASVLAALALSWTSNAAQSGARWQFGLAALVASLIAMVGVFVSWGRYLGQTPPGEQTLTGASVGWPAMGATLTGWLASVVTLIAADPGPGENAMSMLGAVLGLVVLGPPAYAVIRALLRAGGRTSAPRSRTG